LIIVVFRMSHEKGMLARLEIVENHRALIGGGAQGAVNQDLGSLRQSGQTEFRKLAFELKADLSRRREDGGFSFGAYKSRGAGLDDVTLSPSQLERGLTVFAGLRFFQNSAFCVSDYDLAGNNRIKHDLQYAFGWLRSLSGNFYCFIRRAGAR